MRIEETRLVEWAAWSTVALRDSPCWTSYKQPYPAPLAERLKSHSSTRTAARRKEGGRSQHVGDVINEWVVVETNRSRMDMRQTSERGMRRSESMRGGRS